MLRPKFKGLLPAMSVAAIVGLSACGGSDSPSGPGNSSVYPSTLVPSSNNATPGTRTSQAPTNGQPPGPAFDDFTLSNGGSVRVVSWQGVYCRQTAANSPAPSPTASNFVVSIYSDASGRPNTSAALKTATFTTAQTNEKLDKTVAALACGPAANTTWALYSYSATLPSAFTAAAGTKYWISIVATTPSYDVIYGWRDGTVANNISLQLFQGAYTALTVDRAFSIAP